MQRLIILAVLSLLLGAFSATAHAKKRPPGIEITRADGTTVKQRPEDTSGLLGRPVTKTRQRLHKRYAREFVYLYQIDVSDGEKLNATYQVGDTPLRITLYEIAKDPNAERTLKVIGSKFYEAGVTAEWNTEIEKHEEHIFIVTAEQTQTEDELNRHLQYMNEQNDNEILVKGFSSNWNLTQLKFKLAENNGGTDERQFAKDGEWLVDKLIEPKWVCLIHVM